MAPNLGNLTTTDVGYQTPLGSYTAQTNATAAGDISIDFSAPTGTSGSVAILYPSCSGTMTLVETNGACEGITVQIHGQLNASGSLEIDDLAGGDWQLRFTCSS